MKQFAAKKLLILGASSNEINVVQKAQELGIYVVVTDSNLDYELSPAKKYADEVWNISWAEIETIEKKCIENKIDGVLAGYSELRIFYLKQLCDRLHLPCYIDSLAQLDIMTKKDVFKRICKQYSVPTVEDYDYQQLKKEDYRTVKYPVIVKPVDNGGSIGISICRNREELLKGIEKGLENSRSKNIIIEKYMTGDEIVIYYTFQDGQPIFTGMCDRYTNKEQQGVAQLPTSYIFPSRHIRKYAEEVDAAVKNMFRGINVNNGVMFLQCFVDENGNVRIYEPGFRLNGAKEYFIINGATGVDTRECMIHFALTGKMAEEDLSKKINPFFNKWGCKLSPLVKEGKIAKLEGLNEITALKGVVAVNRMYDVGGCVKFVGTLHQIICRFFIVADTKEELKEVIDKIHNLLKVEDEQGNSMLLGLFDTKILDTRY